MRLNPIYAASPQLMLFVGAVGAVTALIAGSSAILQRDIPLLQGTILVLAMIFVSLNLLVDIIQPLLDPRIRRT